MISTRGLIKTLTGWIGKPIAGPDTDPQRFFGTMFALPNPDPILREMGQAERVYASIMADPHVMGEVRSIRGSFRSHDYRWIAGNEADPKSVAAKEMVEQWMRDHTPNEVADWLEVMWQMTMATLHGYRVHEPVWNMVGNLVLPTQVFDRPARRVKFNANGQPMLVSTGNMVGAVPENPYALVISRHMADTVNPYGVALLSSCFWAWTFKTGGWRYFVKYCERHGLPWPVGRYPLGTGDVDQAKLAEALASMIESAYAVVPEGNSIELLVPSNSGSMLPQENLINLCNREMSKALTGQAMVAELNGVGSRAAADTAQRRQNTIHDADRDIASQGFGKLAEWITLLNIGPGVAPPRLDFYQHENAGKERAETYQIAAQMGARPSMSAMLEELGMPQAEDDADALQPVRAPAVPPPDDKGADDQQQLDLTGIAGFEFARAAGMTEDEAIALAADAADRAIEDKMIAPVAAMLAQYEADGRTLAEFHADLQAMVGAMDDGALREVIERSLTYSIAAGAASRAA